MRTVLAVCLVGGLVGSGQAALVDSDLGAVMNGGGCYPPGLTVTGPTDPTLVNPVNPEWAPDVDGLEVDSDPVLILELRCGTDADCPGGESGGAFALQYRIECLP